MEPHRNSFIVLLIGLTLLLEIGPFDKSLGRTEERPVPTLDPILVTGTAHPTRLHRSTQSYTVLDHHEFSLMQPNRLSSILQQIPAVHLDEMGPRGGLSSIYLRGADPNFTLIMLDGIPLNDSTDQRGGAVDLSTIPIDQVTRVEIVRGPLSAFYGSEAMAGAINLVTDSQKEDSKARVLLEGGRFDAQKGVLQGHTTLGPLSAQLSLSHASNEEQVEKDAFSQQAIGWNLGMNSGIQWNFRITGQYAHSSIRSFPEGSGGSTLALLRETEKRQTRTFLTGITASLESPERWHHQIFLSLSQRNQDVVNPGVLSSPLVFQIPPTRFTTDYRRYQGRLTETWDLTSFSTFSFGGQLTYERGTRDGTQDLSSFGGQPGESIDFSLNRTYGGSFLELTTTAWENLTVYTGARLDLAEQTQPRVSPRFSIRFQLLPLLNLRGSYGKGFKLPGLASLGDPVIGNAALEPETSTGWDIGMDFHTPNQEFTTSVAYFDNRFEGLIDLDPALLAQGQFRLTNLDTAVTKGIEFSLKLTPIRNITFQSNLTYLATRLIQTGEPLRNRPRWRGGIGLIVQLSSKVSLSSRITFLSSRLDFQIPTQTTRVGGYSKADATLTYYPAPGWQWYAAIENLTNSSYEEFRGFQAAPLTFRLGIECWYSSVL